jgi:hypothetical protein
VSASRRRTVIVSVAALAVAFMLVLAAATGPSDVVGDVSTGPPTDQTLPTEEPTPSESAERTDDAPPNNDRVNDLGEWIHELLWFTLLVLGLVVTAAALRALALRLTRELPDKQLVLDLEPLPDVEAGRDALRRDLEKYDAALAGSDVRNGIVACWVLLEETASEVGVSRRPAETSTEFVVRFLHTLDVDPRPVAALSALYQEARFSTHDLPDDARARAELALRAIDADLDRSAAR